MLVGICAPSTGPYERQSAIIWVLKGARFEEAKGSTWSDPPILTMTQSAPLRCRRGGGGAEAAAAMSRHFAHCTFKG